MRQHRWARFGLFALAAPTAALAAGFAPTPELGFKPIPLFFETPPGAAAGEASGVAVNSKGHIFLFQRAKPMLTEYDEHGKFIRTLGDGLFDHPHGLRIDADDNLWTTDDGSHVVLKLDHDGRVLMVLGKKGWAEEGDWLFNAPADVAFGRDGTIYVADGYGNSRVVKFDRAGNFLKSWGKYGTGPGEFNLPHTIVVDRDGRVLVGDRENQRIQVFDADGQFLAQWTGIGYPYGMCIDDSGHVWMADGGYDRIVELDANGKIIGAYGEPGHGPGQFAWAHFLALGADHKLYVADVLNWRFQAFEPIAPSGAMAKYVPTRRMFWDSAPSNGFISHQPKP